MTLEYGGLYQEQQASFRELAFALVLAIALVFLVLLIEFRSFAHPIAIVSGAILALGGVLARFVFYEFDAQCRTRTRRSSSVGRVTARITGSDLGTTIEKIKSQLAKDVKLPAGMTLEYGGLYQEQQASFRELAFALVLAIALVFLVLLVEFRSFAHPIAIVSGAILALGGVLLGLFVTGSTLNVVSLMGMIMVIGIVAKNGILMLDAVEEHLTSGDSLRDALILSGKRRIRPVLMTSLAAILGMLPLALAIGAGAELLQPLAIAVIGGLIFALFLSLVFTPTFYFLIVKISEKQN